MQEKLLTFQNRIGYSFKNPALLERALTHCSAAPLHNERFEFLGDAVLGLIITEILHETFLEADEGTLTRMRSHLVCRRTLVLLARELTIGAVLQLSASEQRNGGQKRESILANAFEAIVGAIYLDARFEVVKERILSWYTDRLKGIRTQKTSKDPKTLLQEYQQSKGKSLPNYEIILLTGKAHEQGFVVRCSITGVSQTFIGKGGTRRVAEQIAAEKMLRVLQVKP